MRRRFLIKDFYDDNSKHVILSPAAEEHRTYGRPQLKLTKFLDIESETLILFADLQGEEKKNFHF